MNKLWQRGDCVYSFSLNGSGTSIEFILQSSYKFSCNTTLVLPGVHGMGASKVLKLFLTCSTASLLPDTFYALILVIIAPVDIHVVSDNDLVGQAQQQWFN